MHSDLFDASPISPFCSDRPHDSYWLFVLSVCIYFAFLSVIQSAGSGSRLFKSYTNEELPRLCKIRIHNKDEEIARYPFPSRWLAQMQVEENHSGKSTAGFTFTDSQKGSQSRLDIGSDIVVTNIFVVSQLNNFSTPARFASIWANLEIWQYHKMKHKIVITIRIDNFWFGLWIWATSYRESSRRQQQCNWLCTGLNEHIPNAVKYTIIAKLVFHTFVFRW